MMQALYIGFNRATLAALLQQQEACKDALATIQQTLKASGGPVGWSVGSLRWWASWLYYLYSASCMHCWHA